MTSRLDFGDKQKTSKTRYCGVILTVTR